MSTTNSDHVLNCITYIYRQAAVQIGGIKCFDLGQSSSLSSHVMRVYGDMASRWDTSTITAIGKLLGMISISRYSKHQR